MHPIPDNPRALFAPLWDRQRRAKCASKLQSRWCKRQSACTVRLHRQKWGVSRCHLCESVCSDNRKSLLILLQPIWSTKNMFPSRMLSLPAWYNDRADGGNFNDMDSLGDYMLTNISAITVWWGYFPKSQQYRSRLYCTESRRLLTSPR
jgi:hypothetical protein